MVAMMQPQKAMEGAMKKMPKIGTRVKYSRRTFCGEMRECSGIVVSHYPGYDEGESDHVGVKVWPLPEWWPYPDTDLFAPDIADLRQ